MAHGLTQVRAGEMDRQVSIMRLTSSLNSNFEPIETYALFASIWCKVRHERADETYKNQSIKGLRMSKFITRYRSDILITDTLVHESQTYKIVGINEIGRREIMEIMCEFHQGAA